MAFFLQLFLPAAGFPRRDEMKWSTVAAATVLMVTPLLFSSTATAKDDKNRPITLRGCVVPGADKGTFVLTHVREHPPTGEFSMPEWAHGRRVVYWLKNLKDLTGHAGHMAEVRGVLTEFKNSEVELKAGRQKSGDVYVEFEGPGKDIRASNAEVGSALGTAGRADAEKKDMKTMLAVIDVKDVKRESDTCQ
jgi:hypothetical protein